MITYYATLNQHLYFEIIRIDSYHQCVVKTLKPRLFGSRFSGILVHPEGYSKKKFNFQEENTVLSVSGRARTLVQVYRFGSLEYTP